MLPWSAEERWGVKPHLLSSKPPAEVRRRGCVLKNQSQSQLVSTTSPRLRRGRGRDSLRGILETIGWELSLGAMQPPGQRAAPA